MLIILFQESSEAFSCDATIQSAAKDHLQRYAVVCHIPGIVSVVFDKRIFAPWKMLTSTVCKLCIHIVFKFNLNSRSLFVPPVGI